MTIGAIYEGITYVAILPTPDDVPTICRGHTKGVKMGDTATEEQCDKWFAEEMAQALAVVDANLKVSLPDHTRGALGDFVYNEGATKFITSTMLKKFNAGDTVGGCVALLDWEQQKGKFLGGLAKRRQEELRYCLGVKR